jgi:hypothetical protein
VGRPLLAFAGLAVYGVRPVYRGALGRLMTGITLFEAVNFAAVLLILRATTLLQRQDLPLGPAAVAGRRRRRGGAARTPDRTVDLPSAAGGRP